MRIGKLMGLAGLIVGLGIGVANAGEMQTLMAEPGKVLVSDDFSSSTIDPAWKALKGKWQLVDGALKGVELKSDQHAAVVRRDLKVKDLVAQFTFKFDGGKQTSFSINGAKGHVCRVVIRQDGFSLVKDRDKKKAGDKPAVLAQRKVDIKPGEWHTMVVEVVGNDMVASLDGGKDKAHVAIGSNPAINVEKGSIGFPTSGDGVVFDNVKIFEAQAKAGREDRKKELALGH